MKNLLVVVLAASLLFTFLSTHAYAHDYSQSHTNTSPYIIPTEKYMALVNYLSEFVENSKRYSVPVTSEEEKRIGDELLKETYTQFIEIIDLKGTPGIADKVILYIKMDIFPKLNPLTMGKKVLDLSRRVGPRFAITITAVEILENLTYFLAAYNPKFAFLIPVVFFHGYDAIGFTYIFGIPFLIERAGIYKRFGGYKEGPEGFYQFLIGQKNTLPLDWSVVVDVQNVKLSTQKADIELVILKKNILEKFLSPQFRKIIFPRRTAQRETSNALSITDLQQIAKLLKINLFTFRGMSQELYSRMLIAEILSHVQGSVLISQKLKQQNKGIILKEPLKDSAFDATQLLRSKTVTDLSLIGESPDILASRLMWHIFAEAEEIKNSTETKKIDYRLLREIVSLANKDLKQIAETDHSKNPQVGFNSLYKSLSEIKVLIKQFESKPKLCRRVLFEI